MTQVHAAPTIEMIQTLTGVSLNKIVIGSTITKIGKRTPAKRTRQRRVRRAVVIG